MDGIRIPKQKRSIEKKERIIKSGLALFSTKGYYNTNTAEIAKHAGVSTGIVYNYFSDKKDIFMDAIDIYNKEFLKPIYSILDKLENISSVKCFIYDYIKDSITNHKNLGKSIYREIEAIKNTDEDFEKHFNKLINESVDLISTALINKNFPKENIHEKVHIIFSFVEKIIHEIAYYNEINGTNSDVIIEYTAELIENLLLK